jgi:hypothetical protein
MARTFDVDAPLWEWTEAAPFEMLADCQVELAERQAPRADQRLEGNSSERAKRARQPLARLELYDDLPTVEIRR